MTISVATLDDTNLSDARILLQEDNERVWGIEVPQHGQGV